MKRHIGQYVCCQLLQTYPHQPHGGMWAGDDGGCQTRTEHTPGDSAWSAQLQDITNKYAVPFQHCLKPAHRVRRSYLLKLTTRSCSWCVELKYTHDSRGLFQLKHKYTFERYIPVVLSTSPAIPRRYVCYRVLVRQTSF